MKLNALLLLAGLATLATSCGQDAASKKLADETEARVVASIKQVLVQAPAQGAALDPVHTWYQSDVPNIIKLDPNAEAVYRDHAAILQEVAANQNKLASDPILTPAQGKGVRTMYQKIVDESATNVQQLTLMATGKTTMSEAEQRQFVAGVADKEKKELGLVRYFTKRTAFGIDQETRKKNQKKFDREVWGR
jgi:hypothetical protein